ncbi:MAG TPA: twin-arginine translocase subunit TatC [Anaerolineales bacterium]|nr:twin-arginine translocase subunit TatC [Anaerolineales bacterium]
MSTQQGIDPRPRRDWSSYLRALGSAHRKASVELATSMPLLQHLDELRQRLFRAFLVLVVTTGASFAFAQQLTDYLARPIGGIHALVSIEITENIGIFMKVALLSGFLFAMPVIVYEILAFVLPGLKPNEKRWLLLVVPLAGVLFATGVAFTWFIMLPSALPFLTGFMGITTQVRPENYFEFTTRLMFWIGICFELPLVVMFLAKLKFVTAGQLVKWWRYAIVVTAIVAAAVTPTVDPVNMGLVMAPLIGLYVISIVLAAMVNRG